MPEKLLTLREVAQHIGLPEAKIKGLVASGVLPAYRIGGEFLRFRKEQVDAIKNELKSRADSLRDKAVAGYVEPVKEVAVYVESGRDRLLDFLYFNDFYIISAAITIALLIIIFK